MHTFRVALALAGAAALAGCSSSHPAAAPHTSHTSQPRPTPRVSSVQAALPAGLAGVWQKKFQGGEQKMALEPGQYRFYVNPADAAAGALTVSGKRLTFSDSNTCSGTGRYRFVLSGAKLRLIALGSDPCPRSAFMTGTPWTRKS
jgi:hypothetical protein